MTSGCVFVWPGIVLEGAGGSRGSFFSSVAYHFFPYFLVAYSSHCTGSWREVRRTGWMGRGRPAGARWAG